ncbi:GNAT family N-acetyltransferase [Chitinophaga sp. Cy-1792]|uniref:GNAT family N-acetyltransferase n=1 Tax=Chitinophaga sp. Cy-1792 TaxID=2608339 RepID=UPI00141E2297|nr:GNAT family N-acetyltransferase [Chitinophaga sp. Cy-1792]NIG57511.1 GNAT family N-acetyltransferase [Chitinophaga sp. Cy-1792]
MNDWMLESIMLEGQRVLLMPVTEEDVEDIVQVSLDPRIWTFMPISGTESEIRSSLQQSLSDREKKVAYPFIIIDKLTNRVIGSTRFLNAHSEHHTVEIGWTWFIPPYWGKGYNEECKLLLLNYCFDELKTIRVGFTAAEKNTWSRTAIENIGAKFEGILRNIVIRHDGRRNCAIYSITEEEWPETKTGLEKLAKEKFKMKQII